MIHFQQNSADLDFLSRMSNTISPAKSPTLKIDVEEKNEIKMETRAKCKEDQSSIFRSSLGRGVWVESTVKQIEN